MNYIDTATKSRLTNTELRNLAQWFVNSKTNNKMNIINRYIEGSAKYILKYVNSKKDYDDMAEYLSLVRGQTLGSRFYTEGTLSRFMNANASVRKNVLKDMREKRHAKVFARIGNKNELVELLWVRSNMNVPRKRFESLSVDTLRKMLLNFFPQ